MSEQGSIRLPVGVEGRTKADIRGSTYRPLERDGRPYPLSQPGPGVIAGAFDLKEAHAAASRLDSYLIDEASPKHPTREPSIEGRAPGYTGKRSLDIAGSVAALVFFAPLMFFIALLVWAFDGGPALFSQERIGFGGRRFRILKFRTMKANAKDCLAEVLASDSMSNAEWLTRQKLLRDPRITRLGRFLRLSSLDELPQLINVIRGDMSLVGPRPIVEGEHLRYGRYFHQYCAVRPGITGLWQVSGRNNTTYRRRVAIDVAYSRRCCLAQDLWILLRTVPSLLSGEGSY
jgi:exopolysaccharide production protein ExoY